MTMNLDVIANLSPETNRPDVLEAVALWHEGRRGVRSRYIAQALRMALAANDNVAVGERRVAA